MRLGRTALFILLAVTASSPLRAQEYEVTRRTFSFYDQRLDIDILATSPGQLQLIRGEASRIEVAAHAQQGVASFGLANDAEHTLRLTALGAVKSDYIVTIPEHVAVRIRLPGHGWTDATVDGSKHFSWEATEEVHEMDHSFPKPGIEDRYYLMETRDEAPPRLRLLHSQHIRAVEVRVEGTEFQLASSVPLTDRPGTGPSLDVDPGQEDVDLLIQVPSFNRQFELQINGETVLSIANGAVTQRCGPALTQTTATGASRVTLRPAGGMTCPPKGR